MKYFENYRDVKKVSGIGTIRNNIRSMALSGLSIFDHLKGFDQELTKPRIQFLNIHHVFKDEEVKLDALLKKLSHSHFFISYSEAIHRISTCTIDKPYIVFSFDDGFKNNLRAAEILNKNNALACFFINPSSIGLTDYQTIKWHCANRLTSPPVEFLNWDQITQLKKMGHEIGSHTMEHIEMMKMGDLIIEDCRKSYEILLAKCGEAKHFAFPYGRFANFNEFARNTVFNTGFISCASAERGCHINPDQQIPYKDICIRRDHIILDWPIGHIMHFIAKNSRTATTADNFFPYKKG